MLIGSKWPVLISLFSKARNASFIVHVLVTHMYRICNTYTSVAAYSGFVLEQHQLSIKSPAVSTMIFSKFSSLSTGMTGNLKLTSFGWVNWNGRRVEDHLSTSSPTIFARRSNQASHQPWRCHDDSASDTARNRHSRLRDKCQDCWKLHGRSMVPSWSGTA